MRISLIVPARNEEKNLCILVPKILEKYGNFFREIIIVNDSSTDNTEKVVRKLAGEYKPRVKLVNRQKPNGVGYAIRDGLRSVSGNAEWIMTMDADFLHNIKDIQKFIGKAQQGFDGVVGSRFLDSHSLVRYPLAKRVANRAYHFLLRHALGLKLRDVTNNFKLYRKEVFDAITLKEGNFAVNAEIGLLPVMKGYRVAEVPVLWQERDYGKSKFTVFKLGPSYLRVFYRVWKDRKNFRK